MWWILVAIVCMTLLYTGKRNVVDANGEPVGFVLAVYLLVFVLCLVPIVNIICTMTLCLTMAARLASYEENGHYFKDDDSWHVKEGRKNWIWSMYKLFTKKF